MNNKILSLVSLVFLLLPLSFSAQTRRPARPVSKPATTAATPVPKAKTPAEALFYDGLKCPKEDFDCQVSNYTKAINLGLNTKDVYKNRGNAYLHRKDFDKAVADFSKVIELDPNDTSGYKDRGKLYLEISNSPQATNAAIRDFTSAIDLEPKDVEAYSLRSSAYMKLRNFDKAKADMDKIAAIEPNNVDVMIRQAQMFFENKDYDKAVEAFGKAISLKPSASTYQGRGNAYLVQKKYELAVTDLSKAIELDPQNANAYESRGKAYLSLSKLALAVQDIQKSVEIDPKRNSASLDLAKSFERDEKYDQALVIVDIILASMPKDEVILYKHGWLNLLNQNPESAIVDATKILEVNPKNAKALELRCMAFNQMRDYESAVEECTDAITLDSTLEYAYLTRGSATFNITGKMEGAAQSDFDKSYANQVAGTGKILAENPDDYDSLVKRGLAYMGTKNYVASIQDYKKLIELYPSYEMAYVYLGTVNSLANGITEATIPGNRAFSMQILSQGISANPNSVVLYYHRGANHIWDDHRSSITDYLRAAENYKKKSNPSSMDKIYAQIAISQAATKYHLLKDNASAVSTINICDEFFPDSLGCLKSKGDLYNTWLKDYPKAVQFYSRAVELYPSKKAVESTFDMPNTLYSLAEAYFGLKDKVTATATINKGLSQFPENKHMWDYAAMFYKYKLNDASKATEYYKKAAQLGSASAQMNLGFIAEEKRRKKERRNAAILGIMGAVNQTLETYNNNRRTSTVSQVPQINTPSRTQTTSGQPTAQGGTSSQQSSSIGGSQTITTSTSPAQSDPNFSANDNSSSGNSDMGSGMVSMNLTISASSPSKGVCPYERTNTVRHGIFEYYITCKKYIFDDPQWSVYFRAVDGNKYKVRFTRRGTGGANFRSPWSSTHYPVTSEFAPLNGDAIYVFNLMYELTGYERL